MRQCSKYSSWNFVFGNCIDDKTIDKGGMTIEIISKIPLRMIWWYFHLCSIVITHNQVEQNS